MHRVSNDAPATVAGRDVVPNVPDLFGNLAVRAFDADAAHGQESKPGYSSFARIVTHSLTGRHVLEMRFWPNDTQL